MKAHHQLVYPLALGTLILAFSALDLVCIRRGDAQPKPQTGQEAERIELLFVQNGTSGTYDGKRLTLVGVGPTVFFSDRPYRVTGHVTTSEFISHWDKGSDNFAGNPPNATLSMFGAQSANSAVVELTDPKLRKNTLSYQVKVLQGSLPSAFGESSLFIDILGRWRMFARGAAVGSASAAAHSYHQPPPPAPAAAVYTAPPPPPAVNVTVTGAATDQAAAVAKLKELKGLLKQGLITQSQYQAESQKLLDQIVE